MRLTLICLATVGMSLGRAHAASFDCAKAQTSRETLVCSDKELSAQDTDLAKAYAVYRAKLSEDAAELVKADQIQWLHWVDRICTVHPGGIYESQRDCIRSLYGDRKTALGNAYYRSPAGQVFYMRSQYLIVPGHKGQDAAETDPGYGAGDFLWPQIDRPDANGAAWNAAIAARAKPVAYGKSRGSDQAALEEHGTRSQSYTIFAADSDLIAVWLTTSVYEYGGAHPITNSASFLYWPRERREVVYSDVLRKDVNWPPKLNALAKAHLEREQNDLGLWTGDELRSGIAETNRDFRNWAISRKGLTIHFNAYAVASYAAGPQRITIPWAELGTMLNPALKPETLPVPRRGS